MALPTAPEQQQAAGSVGDWLDFLLEQQQATGSGDPDFFWKQLALNRFVSDFSVEPELREQGRQQADFSVGHDQFDPFDEQDRQLDRKVIENAPGHQDRRHEHPDLGRLGLFREVKTHRQLGSAVDPHGQGHVGKVHPLRMSHGHVEASKFHGESERKTYEGAYMGKLHRTNSSSSRSFKGEKGAKKKKKSKKNIVNNIRIDLYF